MSNPHDFTSHQQELRECLLVGELAPEQTAELVAIIDEITRLREDKARLEAHIESNCKSCDYCEYPAC